MGEKNKSSVSKASTYEEMGQFWSRHDLADYWDQTETAEFAGDIQSERIYYPLDRDLSRKIAKIAQQRGVSAETLVNLWVKDKLEEHAGTGARL